MAGYTISSQNALHYLTLTTVGWVDVFTRQRYRNILLESLAFCQREKGLILHAYVIMSNHLHMIAQAQEPNRLSDILRDFKKFTSAMIIKSIQEEPESRRDWLLLLFRYHARFNKNNSLHQLWQRDNHPIELYSPDFICGRSLKTLPSRQTIYRHRCFLGNQHLRTLCRFPNSSLVIC